MGGLSISGAHSSRWSLKLMAPTMRRRLRANAIAFGIPFYDEMESGRFGFPTPLSSST
jgi:hypothetical protein